MVELKGYKVNSISFENKVANGIQLKLQNQVKYNVNYIDAENKCVGILNFKVSDTDMQPFEIRIEMIGEFSFDSTDEKPDIHINSFDQIFPFLRQIISNTTTMCGMPGLMIPIIRLERSSVSVGDLNKNNDDEGMLN